MPDSDRVQTFLTNQKNYTDSEQLSGFIEDYCLKTKF